MSTLGGSRGERHAKPKFSALDINSLYRSSRGESLEPSTQKNAVPRKHGMQSLGKVPSARRPPANLPSLKAETTIPLDQQGTWGGSDITNQTQTVTPPPPILTVVQVQSAAVAQQQQQQQGIKQTTGTAVPVQVIQTTAVAVTQPIQQQQQQVVATQQQQQQTEIAPTANLNINNSNSTNNLLVSTSSTLNNTSPQSAASWSSVATGVQAEIAQPPIYQSPQFQHEFPSLDGSVAPGVKSTIQSNSHDGQQMSLRPQTDVASWMQHQQQLQTGNRGGENGGAPVSQQGQALQQVPLQFRALMPPFMYRGGPGGGGGGQQGPGVPNAGFGHPQQQQQQQHQQLQQNYSQIQARPRSQPGAQSSGHFNTDQPPPGYNQGGGQTRRGGGSGPQQQQQQRQQNDRSDRSNSVPYVEVDVALQQRPIIKEEELERMHSIAKDDGWAKTDDIDYNQKLQFSDDEAGDNDGHHHKNDDKESHSHKKGGRQDEDNRAVWNREKEREHQGREREKAERERNERERIEHERNERNERDRNLEKEREQRERESNTNKERIQQNGHRSTGLDAEVVERAKQRREEEEKREFDRKKAAAKKLQELEQKMQKKSSERDFDEKSSPVTNDFRSMTQIDQAVRPFGGPDRNMKSEREKERDYNRYDKYERETNSRERDYRENRVSSDGNVPFSRQFQSNLPPRFQKQQQERTQPTSGGYTNSRQGTTNFHQSENKNVPFAQQYDPRYIHSNFTKQQQQQQPQFDRIRRRPGEERRRGDSEEEDRFSSGRESIGRSGGTPQLARSISDSSQRKTSVSSEEKPFDRVERSESREFTGSWADELEGDMKKLDIKTELNCSDGHDEPKHILQRVKPTALHEMNKESEKRATPPPGSRKSESPKSWADSVVDDKSIELNDSISSVISGGQPEHKKSLESIPEKPISISESDKKSHLHTSSSSIGSHKDSDDTKHGMKRPSPRGGRNEPRQSTRGGYTNYRGNTTGQSWGNRRGGPRRYGDNTMWTESEGSEDDEFGHKRERGPKVPRKEPVGKYQMPQKEGFAPRGEPSRRGRGSGGNTTTTYNRRGSSNAPKRIEGYGPPSSKSPFGPSDEKFDLKFSENLFKMNSGEDKTKLNQMALSAGLTGKTKPIQQNRSNMKPPGKPFDETYDESEQSDSQELKKLTVKPSISNASNSSTASSKTSSKPVQKFKTESQTKKDDCSSDDLQKSETGFQEVKNKKTFKKEEPRTKPKDERSPSQTGQPAKSVISKPPGIGGKPGFGGPQIVQNMAQMTAQNKAVQQQDRDNRLNRQNKLPPRFAKQRENNRLQRAAELNGGGSMLSGNAWEKPLNTSLREIEDDDTEIMNDVQSQQNQLQQQQLQIVDTKTDINKPLLDGSTPPVTTIIFENTNYKTAPPPIKRMTNDTKKSDDLFKTAEMQQDSQQDSISTVLSTMTFPKTDLEFEKDLKQLGFTFDSELSQLTDDKNLSASVSKGGLCMPRASMHSVTSAAQNIISPSTADLNMKIASVKNVWESVPAMPTVLEHSQVDDQSGHFVNSQHQQHMHQYSHPHQNMSHSQIQHALSPGPAYSTNFGQDPSALEQHFGKSVQDVDQESGYGHNQHPGQNMSMKQHAEALATSTNVCKVKPTQQQLHQSALGLSPPPMQQQQGLQGAPQQYYQPSQYGGISAIPSPPAAVLFNSSQMPSQAGLYGPFQIEAGRSQFSQYPGHYGTAGNAPYSAYMQTQPNLQSAPTQEMYQNLASQFRMGGAAVPTQFNQTQQLSNPNTVLISSSSNSLMSASVKPSSQQIGAIGSKTNAQYGQQYMGMYPQQAQQLQNNSYYSNSAGGPGAYFGGQTAQANQSYNLQAGMYGAPGQSNAQQQQQQQQVAGFGSQFLNSPLLAAAAISQQYQQQGRPNPQSYMKTNQQQSHMQDSNGRQLKSPLSNDGGLNLKQAPPQASPPHHKNYAPNWELQNQMQQSQQQQNQQNRTSNTGLQGRPGQGQQRYPAPIQRPNYSQSTQQINQSMPPQRTRMSQPVNKHYYANRGGHVVSVTDQNIGGNVKSNDKSMEGQQTVTSQDVSSKEDGTE